MRLNDVKKSLKKFFLYLFAACLGAGMMISVYIYFPQSLESLDNRIRDFLFIVRGEEPQSGQVVIIDIDEKSLSELGQWPWSRNKVAQMLENLALGEAAVVGFDIVFAEHDNSSPHKVLKELNIQHDNIPNYDEIFTNVVVNTPTILGYQFQLEDEDFIVTKPPEIPAIYIEKNRPRDENGKPLGEDYILNAKGTILNIPILQDNAYSSGFFNNVPDPSGIIRSVPLIIRYQDQLFPSLALEIVRASSGIERVYVNYNENGVESVSIGDFYIPTDRHGRSIGNFRGKEKTFKYLSAVDIYNNEFKKDDIAGKIVLIGTSAAGLLDLRAIPFESVFPGVEVHANLIDNILTQDFITKPSWAEALNLFNILMVSILVTFFVAYTLFWLNPFIGIGFVLGEAYLAYYSLFTEGIVISIIFPLLTIFLAVINTTLINYFFEIKKEKAIKKKFASKVSKEVMDSLLKNIDEGGFDAMDKEITIMFSDVRGFTNISEAMPNARALIDFLNMYMTPMTNIIIEEKGTVDKYIGDAIMAYWNAPGNIENHQDKALTATIRQIEHLIPLNKTLKAQGLPHIDIGIGLNTGVAIVGEMGSEQRSDYTCIGDAINLGARLESLCKSYGARIIISEFLKNGLKDTYQMRNLDFVMVKGQTHPVEIFEVYSFGELSGRLKQEIELFNKAVTLYRGSSFQEALDIFKEVNIWEDKQNKKIYDIYISRCEHYIQEPPENFNGVFVHTTKG